MLLKQGQIVEVLDTQNIREWRDYEKAIGQKLLITGDSEFSDDIISIAINTYNINYRVSDVREIQEHSIHTISELVGIVGGYGFLYKEIHFERFINTKLWEQLGGDANGNGQKNEILGAVLSDRDLTHPQIAVVGLEVLENSLILRNTHPNELEEMYEANNFSWEVDKQIEEYADIHGILAGDALSKLITKSDMDDETETLEGMYLNEDGDTLPIISSEPEIEKSLNRELAPIIQTNKIDPDMSERSQSENY